MARQSKNDILIATIKQKGNIFAKVDPAFMGMEIIVGTSIPSQSQPGQIFINSTRQQVFQRGELGWKAIPAYYWIKHVGHPAFMTNIPPVLPGDDFNAFALNLLEHYLRSISFDGETTDFNDKGDIAFKLSLQLRDAFVQDFMQAAPYVVQPKALMAIWIAEVLGKKKKSGGSRLPPMPTARATATQEELDDAGGDLYDAAGDSIPFSDRHLDELGEK